MSYVIFVVPFVGMLSAVSLFPVTAHLVTPPAKKGKI